MEQRGTRVALIALALVSVVMFLFGVLTDKLIMRLAFKPIPVLVCALLVYRGRRDGVGRVVAAGLVASALGDVLLELQHRLSWGFLAGMVAFFIGHALYTVAFVRIASKAGIIHLLPFLAWGFGVGWLVWSGLGSMRLPVLLYMGVILAMMWRVTVWVAVDEVRGGIARLWPWVAMIGALFYGLSDSLIALNKFHGALDHIRPPIILTYWIGQASIALAIVKRGRLTPHSEVEPDLDRG